MKLITTCSILIILLMACSQPEKNSIPPDTNESAGTLHSPEEMGPDLQKIRKEFIDSYQEKIVVDTFFIAGNRKYNIILKHYCSYDSSLVIPAKYNFDINKDFQTHNFRTDFTLMTDEDTVFQRTIEKSMFKEILNPEEISYGTLFDPTLHLINDSITIHYSISIPVTDVGLSAQIKFDTVGKYTISR